MIIKNSFYIASATLILDTTASTSEQTLDRQFRDKGTSAHKHLRAQTAPRQGAIDFSACAHDGTHIVQVSEVHHGGSHVPRRARPPQTFFNHVITACGWGTKVAELERYLLGGRIKGPPGAIALILGRQRGLAASSEPSAKNTPRNSQRVRICTYTFTKNRPFHAKFELV